MSILYHFVTLNQSVARGHIGLGAGEPRPRRCGHFPPRRFGDVRRWSLVRFLVACYATLRPALSVRWSVGPLVRHTLLFFGFCGLWPHCSCPSDQVTSNMAPAHPHATGVAVYPALFYTNRLYKLQNIHHYY